jgi:hypothetical protein
MEMSKSLAPALNLTTNCQYFTQKRSSVVLTPLSQLRRFKIRNFVFCQRVRWQWLFKRCVNIEQFCLFRLEFSFPVPVSVRHRSTSLLERISLQSDRRQGTLTRLLLQYKYVNMNLEQAISLLQTNCGLQ